MTWTEEAIVELWLERSSVREFDGHQRRDVAERAAYYDLKKLIGPFVVPDVIRQAVKLTTERNERG